MRILVLLTTSVPSNYRPPKTHIRHPEHHTYTTSSSLYPISTFDYYYLKHTPQPQSRCTHPAEIPHSHTNPARPIRTHNSFIHTHTHLVHKHAHTQQGNRNRVLTMVTLKNSGELTHIYKRIYTARTPRFRHHNLTHTQHQLVIHTLLYIATHVVYINRRREGS